jgi:hypothetical protein
VVRTHLPPGEVLWSCLLALTHGDAGNPAPGLLVLGSWDGLPDPWTAVMIHPEVGDGLLFDARMVHRGSGMPPAAGPQDMPTSRSGGLGEMGFLGNHGWAGHSPWLGSGTPYPPGSIALLRSSPLGACATISV